MSNLELRITFDTTTRSWVAQWLQDEEVLFDFSANSVEAALAGLVEQVGSELAAVTGSIEKDEE